MRRLLPFLILIVIALIAVVAGGLFESRTVAPAALPEVNVTGSGIEAKGGRQPTFDVETGSVFVGSETRAVTVPKLEVLSAPDREPAGDSKSATEPAGA